MKTYTIIELYRLYLEFKKGKPLFEPESVIAFFKWVLDKEIFSTSKELAEDEGNSPFDNATDANADYMGGD